MSEEINIGETIKHGDLQAEYKWVYEVCGPNGRILHRNEFEGDILVDADRANIELRRLGVDDKATIRRRKLLTKLWIGDWEQVVPDEV